MLVFWDWKTSINCLSSRTQRISYIKCYEHDLTIDSVQRHVSIVAFISLVLVPQKLNSETDDEAWFFGPCWFLSPPQTTPVLKRRLFKVVAASVLDRSNDKNKNQHTRDLKDKLWTIENPSQAFGSWCEAQKTIIFVLIHNAASMDMIYTLGAHGDFWFWTVEGDAKAVGKLTCLKKSLSILCSWFPRSNSIPCQGAVMALLPIKEPTCELMCIPEAEATNTWILE